MDKKIRPIEKLCGEISLPGDKSISHRVVFIGSIAKGETVGTNFLKAEDTLHTASAMSGMGIDISIKEKDIKISGKGLAGLRKPAKPLYLGNSGTTMRILPGIIAGQNFEATLTGDESLETRPMKRVIDPLTAMGVRIVSKKGNGLAPLVIKPGSIRPAEHLIKVASAQVKSCILFAGLYPQGITAVTEPYASRDHTERMLEFCGAKISKKGLTVSVEGKRELLGKKFFIPGDISSAAFFIGAASILEGSDVTIREVGLNPTRLGFLNTLLKMGADIAIENKTSAVEPYGDVRVRKANLRGVTIERKDVPFLIDEVPILAVLAAHARGRSVIKGISELRVKETDRIFSMTENMKRMGADIKTEGENLIIEGRIARNGKRLKRASIDSFNDHRTAMAMTVAALASDGECNIKNVSSVNTSFPEFFGILDFLNKG